MPEAKRERIIRSIKFKSFTKNTITSSNELRSCLEKIQEQGYAVDEEDYERGVYTVGAPVMDDKGSVVAGISITTPGFRYSPKRKMELIDMVVEAAHTLSERLGYPQFSNN